VGNLLVGTLPGARGGPAVGPMGTVLRDTHLCLSLSLTARPGNGEECAGNRSGAGWAKAPVHLEVTRGKPAKQKGQNRSLAMVPMRDLLLSFHRASRLDLDVSALGF